MALAFTKHRPAKKQAEVRVGRNTGDSGLLNVFKLLLLESPVRFRNKMRCCSTDRGEFTVWSVEGEQTEEMADSM